jgi:hypothetical protein
MRAGLVALFLLVPLAVGAECGWLLVTIVRRPDFPNVHYGAFDTAKECEARLVEVIESEAAAMENYVKIFGVREGVRMGAALADARPRCLPASAVPIK